MRDDALPNNSAKARPLAYASPAPRKRADPKLFLFAFISAITSLTFGTLIFLMWFATRLRGFEPVGFLWIISGCVIVFSGFVVWLIYLIEVLRRETGDERKRNLRRAVGVAVLLLSNVPICAGYIAIHEAITNAFTIVLSNQGSDRIDNAIISYNKVQIPFGSIEPLANVQKVLSANGGNMSMQIFRNGRTIDCKVDIYVDSDSVGGAKLSIPIGIRDDNSVTVDGRVAR